MSECVLLVHGLWMNAVALYPLQMRVARCGFRIKRFGYPSVTGTPERNVGRLLHFLDGVDADKVHLVGHSLGGLLILRALAEKPVSRVGRVVLLGTPAAGSGSGRNLAQLRGGRWMLGQSVPLWTEADPPLAPPGIEIGVLAGNVSMGLGQFISRLPKPNDGVVTVAETRVVGAADTLVLPVSHSGMLISRVVARQVCAFLKEGRFARA